jgi:hypothetical protein
MPSPHLAAGTHHFCLSDDEGVKCWAGPFAYLDGDKESDTDPSFGESNPCYDESDLGTAACRQYLNGIAPATRGDLLGVDRLWAGGDQSCAHHDGQWACWPSATVPPIPDTALPPRAGNGETVCAAQPDDSVYCTQYPEEKATDAPGNQWGHRVTFAVALHGIRGLAMTEDHVCALDGSGVQCGWLPSYWDWSPGALDRQPIHASLGTANEIAANLAAVCGLSDFTVTCWNTHHRHAFTPPISVVIGRWLFELDSFGEGLKWMQAHVYLRQAPLFQTARDCYGQIPAAPSHDLTRLFLMQALAPYAFAIDSAFFGMRVIPRYRERLAAIDGQRGIHSLADIPRSAETISAALRLSATGLRIVQQSEATAVSWEAQLLALAGQAIADPTQVPAFAGMARAHASDLTARGAEGALILSLAAYLGP